MMRAAVVEELADAARAREIPTPEDAHAMTGPRRVLVEVHAASVSLPDLLQGRGGYQLSTEPPFVSGGELAGVVVEADPESGFIPGEVVLDPMERRFSGTVARVLARVVELAGRGALRPRIGVRLSLEEGAETLRVLNRRAAVGNIVVDVRPPS
jgi:NADPH:quinone reductase-like Zn-dependent oxidoreductase